MFLSVALPGAPTKVTCVPTAWFLLLLLLLLLILPSPPLATLLVFLAALNHVCIQFSCFLEDTAARLFQSFKWLAWKSPCYRDSVSYNGSVFFSLVFFFLNFESSIYYDRFTRMFKCKNDYSNLVKLFYVLWRKWETKFFSFFFFFYCSKPRFL